MRIFRNKMDLRKFFFCDAISGAQGIQIREYILLPILFFFLLPILNNRVCVFEITCLLQTD